MLLSHALTNFPAESARGGLHSSHIYDSFKRIRKICFWGIVEALTLYRHNIKLCQKCYGILNA